MFNLQPLLADKTITLKPLLKEDFESLYAVASDPLIWEQHPNRDRYKKEVFQNFFDGAIISAGAFLIIENETGAVIGSTRYYDYDEAKERILIGYTFIARTYWGKNYNNAIKTLMFNYAFQYVKKIELHIGSHNYRSQKAIEKLGAKKIDLINIAYYNEPVKENFVYVMHKEDWKNS